MATLAAVPKVILEWAATCFSASTQKSVILSVLFNYVIFGPKRDMVTGEWRNYIMRSLMICTPHQIFG
jgi:hypothetical protein